MADEFRTPQSANEALLQNILGAENEIREPQSVTEYYLKKIWEQGQGGGGGDGGLMVVNYRKQYIQGGMQYVADHTYDQILSAFNNNKVIIANAEISQYRNGQEEKVYIIMPCFQLFPSGTISFWGNAKMYRQSTSKYAEAITRVTHNTDDTCRSDVLCFVDGVIEGY